MSTLSSSKGKGIVVTAATIYFLPVRTRMPLKFGRETLTEVECCRVSVSVEDATGRSAVGWGETPLSAQWAWPSDLPYAERAKMMRKCAIAAAEAWVRSGEYGHPIDLGVHFQERFIPISKDSIGSASNGEAIPYLAALICISALDIAVHDAYGNLHGIDIYDAYCADYMLHDLAHYLRSENPGVSFAGKFPNDFLDPCRLQSLPVWHLVGALDPLFPEDEQTSPRAFDGYPTLLSDWIKRDGLQCLKIKLRGNDDEWDFRRLVDVGRICIDLEVPLISADFNCTVQDPSYVINVLDKLRRDEPLIFARLLYVEQPFPYDLSSFPIDVRRVSEIKPLFLDESAHDWKHVMLGHSLGWTGVCLKTCKTQTGSLLSFCWARAHGMQIMVQDLTNPMLAQIPHVRLAAKVSSIMGVESNAMQFYPDASLPEASIHPGLYTREEGRLHLGTLGRTGFGYRIEEVEREMPPPAACFER